jgi:hypothetical protein
MRLRPGPPPIAERGRRPGGAGAAAAGAWDLGDLVDQLDTIYRPDGGEPGDSLS